MGHKNSGQARILLILLLISSLSLNASSAGIGLSPGSVRFEGVLREGYAEKTVLLSTSATEPINCMITVSGSAQEWFNFSTERTFVLNPRSHQQLKIMAIPPSDAPNGVYEGLITIVVLPKESPEGGFGSALATGVSLRYSLEVSDLEKKSYRLISADVRDTEEKMSIEVTTVAENDGNVILRPELKIDILNEAKTSVLESLEYSDSVVLPTTIQEIAIKIPNELPIGKYNVRVTAYLDGRVIDEKYMSFEVLEKGSLRIQGRLEQVSLNKIWVYKGEIVEIKALFQNDGVLSTSAVFRGKATIDDEVIGLIESDEIDVPAGGRANLTAYFTPKRTGRYIISGKIYFTKKVTGEKSTILNVIEPEEASAADLTQETSRNMDLAPVALVALIASVVIGLVIWRTKKKSPEAPKKQ